MQIYPSVIRRLTLPTRYAGLATNLPCSSSSWRGKIRNAILARVDRGHHKSGSIAIDIIAGVFGAFPQFDGVLGLALLTLSDDEMVNTDALILVAGTGPH